jgi:hypothetical protein
VSASVTVQLFSEPKGTIHLDVVRPHRPCGRRALGKRDSRCAQVRTAGDTHLYHEVYRKVREDLRDLNGYDLQLIARDETARVDMRAMLEARRHPPDPTDPKPAREGSTTLGLEPQHKIQPPPLGKVHVRRLGWQGLTYVRLSARARHARGPPDRFRGNLRLFPETSRGHLVGPSGPDALRCTPRAIRLCAAARRPRPFSSASTGRLSRTVVATSRSILRWRRSPPTLAAPTSPPSIVRLPRSSRSIDASIMRTASQMSPLTQQTLILYARVL